MAKVLYVSCGEPPKDKMILELEQYGFQVQKCIIGNEQEMEEENSAYIRLEKKLQETFFYFVIAERFYPMLARACSFTGTKYFSIIQKPQSPFWNSQYLISKTNYIFLTDASLYAGMQERKPQVFYYAAEGTGLSEILEIAFSEKEWSLYDSICRLEEVREKSPGMDGETFNHLGEIKDNALMLEKTEDFFDAIELEKNYRFQLKEQAEEYINTLMEKGTREVWQEIVVWNKRNGFRELKSSFWEFFVLWRVLLIYVKELNEWYEYGTAMSVLHLKSMEEMSDLYIRIIFLLRRLEYGIEEGEEIVRYIADGRVSLIFLDYIIETEQIEDKSKVRNELRKLCRSYG